MQVDTPIAIRGPAQARVQAVPLKPLVARPEAAAAGKVNEQPAVPAVPAVPVIKDADAGGPFGKDGFTFFDFLDIINPLQHLPVVSTLYREWTGDTIDPGAKMVGGTLFGGPAGLAGWVVNNLFETVSGKDIGQNILAFFTGGDTPTDRPGAPTLVAEAAPEDKSIATFETAAGAPDQAATVAVPLVSAATETTARAAQDAVRDTERFAAAGRESSRRAAAFARTPDAGPPPSGSLAPEGGWFSNAMLSALQRYQQAADLPSAATAPHAVNELH